MKTFLLFVLLIICSSNMIFAQVNNYEGPDDAAGDIAAERDGYMNGNRVYLYYRNTTELSDWPLIDASFWPNNDDGVRTIDGIGLMVGARVYVENDSTPVDDIEEIQSHPDLDTLYFLQTSYRDYMDTNVPGTIEYGFYPVFGYFNVDSENPAMSNRPSSWPPLGWPAQGDELKWQGEWDGRFGRGVIYADLETYVVVNDAQDQEYLEAWSPVKYYPRPGVKIGEKNPDVTIQNGKNWGGIGARVEQRGFQWNNPQARDAIFWEYEVANISDYNLTEVAFGYWLDTWIGGDNESDDVGYFDTQADMAYAWDLDGNGFGGRSTPIMGFAYLESPGISDGDRENNDDDNDGLVNEKRDNPAMAIIGPTDGIDDIAKFLDFYKLEMEDLKDHWDADEDQDWQDGIDLNNNGIYEVGEFSGDDVGLDGVGPGELNYFGPDQGEGNHRPDYVQGLGCEPNFNATDVSESDMVGLTTFSMININNNFDDVFSSDKSMWNRISRGLLDPDAENLSNLVLVFASGPFPLFKSKEERISMSILHSYDEVALRELKRIVQVIYEKDYRFAQAPRMPTLSATAGDGKVILTWDDVSDKLTKDPFVGNVNDFEGYKLYRATDKKFSDPQVVTDGFGTPSILKPIFQCDIIDTISGFAEFGHLNGALYYLGNESGLVHHYIDTDVQNGRTYYYGLVAYDYGIEDIKISPSENNVVIDLDDEENPFIGINVQIVTPHQKAAGYSGPRIEILENELNIGTGTVTPEILSEGVLKQNHTYKVKFSVDTTVIIPNYEHGLQYYTNGYFVYDVTNDNKLVFHETGNSQNGNNILYSDSLNLWYLNPSKEISSDVFEGLRLLIDLPYSKPIYDQKNSGWISGSAPLNITTTINDSKFFPWEYKIVFTDNNAEYTGQLTNASRVRDEFGATPRNFLTGLNFNFYIINNSLLNSDGSSEKMDLLVQDVNRNNEFDFSTDRVFVGGLNSSGNWIGTAFIIDFNGGLQLPEADDIYRVTYNRPFFVTDSLVFRILPEEALDTDKLKTALQSVKVVPNPYVATNAMESSVGNNIYLNQRRKLMFTNIPAECTIKIFTSSGHLVDIINVDNPSNNGIIHWDLRSKEGLEVAAGMYFYHIKATATKDEKMGKFAIIK